MSHQDFVPGTGVPPAVKYIMEGGLSIFSLTIEAAVSGQSFVEGSASGPRHIWAAGWGVEAEC